MELSIKELEAKLARSKARLRVLQELAQKPNQSLETQALLKNLQRSQKAAIQARELSVKKALEREALSGRDAPQAATQSKFADVLKEKINRIRSANKLQLLWLSTGLAVAIVQHDLDTHWASWESISDFFGYWLVSAIELAIFVLVTSVAIAHFYPIFFERLHESEMPENWLKKTELEERIHYSVLVTVLTIALCIWIVGVYELTGSS